eukprot:1157291-Pelagomonas_calceolata.AAC.8
MKADPRCVRLTEGFIIRGSVKSILTARSHECGCICTCAREPENLQGSEPLIHSTSYGPYGLQPSMPDAPLEKNADALLVGGDLGPHMRVHSTWS